CLRKLDTTQIATGGAFRDGPAFLLGLSVATVDGKAVEATDGAKDAVPYSLRWSPDGSELALIARAWQSADAPLQVFIYHPDMQTLTPMNTHSLVPVADYLQRRPKMFWAARDELLVYAQPESLSAVRADWWAVTEKGQPRNVTQGMKPAPTELLAERGG